MEETTTITYKISGSQDPDAFISLIVLSDGRVGASTDDPAYDAFCKEVNSSIVLSINYALHIAARHSLKLDLV